MSAAPLLREFSPSPAYPGSYLPLTAVGVRVRAKYAPTREDGSIDTLRLWIWERVQEIWAGPAYLKLHGRAGRAMSRAGQIAPLLGLSVRAVKRARLDQPQLPEAWWASYSRLVISLGALCRPKKAAGAYRPVQGAKGQMPSLSGEYARLFCRPAVMMAGVGAPAPAKFSPVAAYSKAAGTQQSSAAAAGKKAASTPERRRRA